MSGIAGRAASFFFYNGKDGSCGKRRRSRRHQSQFGRGHQRNQKNVDLPIIGIIKRDYPGCSVRITPTIREVDELMQVKPDVIAVDATCRRRPDGRKLEEFYAEIREKYPQQLLMADCSTMQEMLYADKLGFDFIGTTLVGYTEESKGCQIEKNDFELIRELIKRVKHPVIGEGNINTPQKLKRVMEIGVYSVVIGSAITRPQLITKNLRML